MKKILLFTIIAVLISSVTITSISAQSQYDIPAWVKGVAGFWAADKITDEEFGEGLSFLIDSDIIKVPKIQELQNEISQLKAENSELRDKLNMPKPDMKMCTQQYDPVCGVDGTTYGNQCVLESKGISLDYKGECTTKPEPEVTITARTSYTTYGNLDPVKISGTVNPVLENKAVSIVIISPVGETIGISQTIPKSDGTFSDSFVAGGPLWTTNAKYIIQLGYGSATTQITIKYIGPVTPIPTPNPASTVTITTADNDLATPGCVETEVGCYTPNTTTVNVGDLVKMVNTDSAGIHTFTSGTVDGFSPSPDGTFDSGMLMTPGDSFEYTTDTVGEFPYYCTLHVWMQGVLIVQ